MADVTKIEEELKKIFSQANEELKTINSLEKLEEWRVKFLGRKSVLANFPSIFKNLSLEDKRKIGSLYNETRTKLESLYEETKRKLTQEKFDFDFYHPGRKFLYPSLTLISHNLKNIINIFRDLGFYILDAPLIVSEYDNFDSLNMPPFHPARDMWDTIWLHKPSNYLLRTHTSAFQVNFLKRFKPPVRGIIPGKVFRFEATDARHDFEF